MPRATANRARHLLRLVRCVDAVTPSSTLPTSVSFPFSQISALNWTGIGTTVATALACLHWFLAVNASSTKSPTFDEPAHLTAGYSYWLRNDYRLDPENGNFPQRWAALPLVFMQPRFVATELASWKEASQGNTAHQFFYQYGNDPDVMLMAGRKMICIFSAALCLVIYFWSRELFGVLGGITSASLTAFCPNILAHGSLVTSDIAVTFFLPTAAWCLWRMFQRITPCTLAMSAITVAGALLAKMSGLLILPITIAMLAITLIARSSIEIKIGRKIIELKGAARTLSLFLALGLITLFAGVSIWASYGFRYSAVPFSDPYRQTLDERWERELQQHGIFDDSIETAREMRLLPEAYLFGLAVVHHHADGRPAFLDGRWSTVGLSSFFPLAFLYKTPIAVLLLLLLVLAVFLAALAKTRAVQVGRGLLATTPLWLVILIYGSFAISSQLNIGHRHILPIYPALYVLIGGWTLAMVGRWKTVTATLVALLLSWHVIDSVHAQPNYLSYLNPIAGRGDQGYKHLVDSSLDWGQDLPALKDWLGERKQAQPVYLAYFGTADPAWYGIEAVTVPKKRAASREYFGPLRGGTYCISATILEQVYSFEMGSWCRPYEQAYQMARADMRRLLSGNPATTESLVQQNGAKFWLGRVGQFQRLSFARLCAYLRQREPDTELGHSILIYNLSDTEVRQALFGPPAELAPDIVVIDN